MPQHQPTSELLPATRLILASLREQPGDDSVPAITGGPLGRELAPEAIHAGLAELRRHGLAREHRGRWHLTRAGHERSAATGGAEPACTVQAHRDGPIATVRIAGRLDDAGGGLLREAIAGLLATDAPPEIVVLDLQELARVDAAGIDAVAEVDGAGRRSGARVVLTAARPAVRHALSAAGVGERLTFVRSLDWSA